MLKNKNISQPAHSDHFTYLLISGIQISVLSADAILIYAGGRYTQVLRFISAGIMFVTIIPYRKNTVKLASKHYCHNRFSRSVIPTSVPPCHIQNS